MTKDQYHRLAPTFNRTQQERQTSQEREREIVETRICNRVGVHTCRANTIHIPFRFCGKIEELLTNPNKD